MEGKKRRQHSEKEELKVHCDKVGHRQEHVFGIFSDSMSLQKKK